MTVFAPARRAPGDRGVADAAAAEHRDAVAPADVAGVHRRAEPGHHAAARGARRPPAVAAGVDLGGLARGDERLLGERADAERGRERRCRR